MQKLAKEAAIGFDSLFEDERLHTLLHYWHDRREGDRFPSRKSIDPLDLAPMLSGIWLSDFEAEAGTYRYRLAGEDINLSLGTSLRGKLLSEIIDREAFPIVNRHLRRVIEEPAVLYVSGTVHRNIDRYSHGERLALPLQTDSDQPNGLLGVTLIKSHLVPMEEGESFSPYRRFIPIPELDAMLGG